MDNIMFWAAFQQQELGDQSELRKESMQPDKDSFIKKTSRAHET